MKLTEANREYIRVYGVGQCRANRDSSIELARLLVRAGMRRDAAESAARARFWNRLAWASN